MLHTFTKISLLAMGIYCTSCQDTSKLKSKWKNLSEIFLKKANAAEDLSTIALDSKKVDSFDVDKVKTWVSVLPKRLKYGNVSDSMIIESIYRTYDSLDIYTTRLIEKLDADDQLKFSHSFSIFKDSYTGLNNKLYVAIAEFNSECRSLNRSDLIYPEKNDNKISFVL